MVAVQIRETTSSSTAS